MGFLRDAQRKAAANAAAVGKAIESAGQTALGGHVVPMATPELDKYMAAVAAAEQANREHAAAEARANAATQGLTSTTIVLDETKLCPTGTWVTQPKPTGPAEQLAALLMQLGGKAHLDPAQVRALIQDELAKRPPHTIEIKVGDYSATCEGRQHTLFPLLLKLAASGTGHILLVGPAGSGKTTAAEKTAETLGRELFIVPPIGDKFEITGFRDAAGNYQDTAVYRWAKAKPGAILLLDEVDGGFAQALLALNTPLANGLAVFPHEQVKIPAEHLVIANGNTWGSGADFDFTGRSKLDAAFLSRFPNKLLWDYDSEFEQELAGNREHAKYIQGIRANARTNGVKLIITPRDTVAYARKRAAGFTHDEALQTGFMAQVKADIRDKLLANLRVPT